MNIVLWILIFICIFIPPSQSSFIQPPYAQWAHSHVIWYNNSQTQTTILKMSQDYMKNQIPFGGFNIDSGWSTCYNNFQWNTTLFPNPKSLIDYFHSHQIKVILWATSVINTNCNIYQEAKNKGYFLNHGKTIKWWHGHGSFIDFFNPQAIKWWQSKMDQVINLGIDGWKCDGTDPMTILLRPWPYSEHKKRYIATYQYSHLYYGVFYNYTKSKNPQTLIMARPVDSFEGKVFLPYAPKYVMFSGWVGDQDPSSDGLKIAMANVIHSAWKKYLNFGFDIGGYRGGKMKISKNIFIRWVQIGSMVPFMENGGNGPHQPWAFDSQTVQIYRKFVLIHYDLKKFFLTAGTQAYKKGVSVIQPLAKKQGFIAFKQLDSYGYILWNTFMVFPIFDEHGIANFKVPSGIWIYYFDHNITIDSKTVAKVFPLDKFPIFIKKGSIYPISRDYLRLSYMNNYTLKNSHLSLQEIVLVYLKQGQHNRIFYSQNHTDYVNIVYNSEDQLKIKIDRFYKNNEEEKNIVQQRNIRVRIIGAEQHKIVNIHKQAKIIQADQKISQKNQQIKYFYDQQSSNDLLFDIEIGQSYKMQNFKFKPLIVNQLNLQQ